MQKQLLNILMLLCNDTFAVSSVSTGNFFIFIVGKNANQEWIKDFLPLSVSSLLPLSVSPLTTSITCFIGKKHQQKRKC